jgi:hypothetical protein
LIPPEDITEFHFLKTLADIRDIDERNGPSAFVEGLLNLMRFDYDEYMIFRLGVEHAARNTVKR